MSSKAQAVLRSFGGLSRSEQLAVYEAIARKVTPADYGPLSDDDLNAIAADSFALLDEEEHTTAVKKPFPSVSLRLGVSAPLRLNQADILSTRAMLPPPLENIFLPVPNS